MVKRYNILTRCLAALALLFVYVASTSVVLVGGTTTSAQARGGRGGRGGGGYGQGAAMDAVNTRVELWQRPRLWPGLWLRWRSPRRSPGSPLLVERLWPTHRHVVI